MIDAAEIICPICQSPASTSKAMEYHDDRYGYPGKFPLIRCSICGHRFLHAAFPAQALQDLYTNYYPRSYFDLENHPAYRVNNAFVTWLNGELYVPFRWVPKGKKVLDIGCGFGESLGYLREQDCDAYGVEADENIRRVAEKYGYNVHVGLFDPANYQANSFDVVTMGQVIEHVTDPLQTLKDIASVLKPGGIAILSSPNAKGWGAKVFGKRWINWHSPYHLHFFTPTSMRIAAEKTGLRLETVDCITPSYWLHAQWLHLLTYPSPGVASIFWSPGGRWSPVRRLCRFVIRLVHILKFDHLVTRLADVLNIGDNRIYFLRKP